MTRSYTILSINRIVSYTNSYSASYGLLQTLTLWDSVNTSYLLSLLCKMGEMPVSELRMDQTNGHTQTA